MRLVFPALASVTIVFSACGTTAAEHWPRFRGESARGVSNDQRAPMRWSDTENVAWKVDLPGRGWSSPIVWGQRVFVTTVVNTGNSEEPRKGLYFGGDRKDAPREPHEWRVICLDLDSGRELWNQQVHRGVPKFALHIKNSYASETPVTDGERVYAYFGNLGLFCFDMQGQPVWSQRFEPVPTRFSWGTAASPVLHGDRIYVVNDNEHASYMLALNKRTGEQVWRVGRDEKSNWATPYIWENGQRTEIITPGTGKTRAYDLSGKLLYEFGGFSSITIAQPYAWKDFLIVSSGYVLDRKKPLFAIRRGASGDISLGQDETSNEFVAWCQKSAAPYNPTTIVYDDQLYVLLDRGLMTSYAPQTGKEIYGRQRLPNGRAFTASPWAYRGHVFCLNEYGVTFVVKAGPEFEISHTNSLGENEMCMATPAIANGKLLIRTDARLFCIATSQP